MSLLALALALVAARIRPRADDPLRAGADRLRLWAGPLVRRLPAGLPPWGAGAVVALALLAALILLESILSHWPTVLVLALHASVLYFALDFGLVGDALRSSRLLPGGAAGRAADQAASDGAASRSAGEGAAQNTSPEVQNGDAFRASIEHLLLGAHRRLLAPVLAYVLVPGIAGLLFYVVLEQMVGHFDGGPARGSAADDTVAGQAPDAGEGRDASSAPADSTGIDGSDAAPAAPGVTPDLLREVYRWTDWVPLRTTSALFAIAGNFEDAAYCWRGAASAPADEGQRAMLLAVGGGALGVRLADAALAAHWRDSAAFEWQAEEPDAEAVQGASGLVSRSAAILGALILLVTLAGW